MNNENRELPQELREELNKYISELNIALIQQDIKSRISDYLDTIIRK